jgi:signal peptide peptidase SppA
VAAIVFDIDSPGGEVAGLFDLVDEIYEARGAKPIYAIANESAYSAAYAIASAADEVYLPRTGGVGSIGVIAIHVDQSSFDEKTGFSYTPIFAGARKNDFSRHEPLSDEARRTLQAEIDEMYDLFVDTVARNRAIEASRIRATEAGFFQGKKAVNAGLADKVLPWDKAIRNITSKTRGGVFMSLKKKLEALLSGFSGEEIKGELAELGYVPQASHASQSDQVEDTPPPDTEQVTEEARQQAVSDTREIVEICALAGMPQMALSLIDSGATAEEARKKVLEAKADDAGDEIISTVGAISTGETNPLVADARRRAEKRRA